ncbi:MAG: hypothetical protein OXB93_03395 [Cytophagales bacterium]|nr:hypothetical protein [Cytophagales bacterium]
MHNITHHISLGTPPQSYKLKYILSVDVKKGGQFLSDRALVRVPAQHRNTWQEIERIATIGKPIHIAFGYDGENTRELSGFIREVRQEKDSVVLDCEDGMSLFRRGVPSRVFPSDTRLRDILSYLITALGIPFDLEVSEDAQDIVYDRFVIRERTAFEVLKQLKAETQMLFYIRNKTLYVQGRYQQDSAVRAKRAFYDFSRNVEKSHLRYVSEADRKIQVTWQSIDLNSQPLEETVGHAGGERIVRQGYPFTQVQSLRRVAQEELKKWSYTGYEGYLSGWLQPYCTYGYLVQLKDENYSPREGTYFVDKVCLSLGPQGGRRDIYLSQRTD